VTGEGRRFVRHAFVCTSGDSCGVDGPAAAIQAALKENLKASGLKEQIRVNKSGCLGQCGHGPMMVVYPEGVWYSHLRLEDVERIWSEHLVGGRPVDELLYKTVAGGTNVVANRSVRGDVRPPDKGPLSSPCSRCPA
jgi:(2Fe-2S) ferredoxin